MNNYPDFVSWKFSAILFIRNSSETRVFESVRWLGFIDLEVVEHGCEADKYSRNGEPQAL